MASLNEHILEIRYEPNPLILDKRGEWADKISKELKFPEWRVTNNRIDVFDNNTTFRGFIGFRNAGFTAQDTSSKSVFKDHSSKFIKFIFDLETFSEKLHIQRMKSILSIVPQKRFELKI
ncbi:MAG: hypothetical protein ABIA04_08450 [Pseudomonadota bacterium]